MITSNKILYQYALQCLARRDYGVEELRRKLMLKIEDMTLLKQVIDKLVKDRWLNDQRFAEHYWHMRQRRGYGSIRIREELKQRGISAETLANINLLATNSVAEVRRKKFGPLLPTDTRQKAQQQRFLQYRGFTSAEIKRVMQHDDD